MRKSLLLTLIMLALFQANTFAQTYHEDDKEGLRKFLNQKTPGGIFGASTDTYVYQQYGITAQEMTESTTSDAWLNKIPTNQFVWNQESPKRIEEIIFRYDDGMYPIASTLDCSKFASLTNLHFEDAGTPNVDYSKNKKLKKLYIAMDPYDPAFIYLNSDNNPILEEATFKSYEFTVEIQKSSTINPNMKKLSFERISGTLDLSIYPNLQELKGNLTSTAKVPDFSQVPNLEVLDALIAFKANLNFDSNKKLKTLILRDHEYSSPEAPSNRPSITLKDIPTLETVYLSQAFNKVALSNLPALNDFKYDYIYNLSIDNCAQIKSLNEKAFSQETYLSYSDVNRINTLSITNCAGLLDIDMPNLIHSKPTIKGCPNLKNINFAHSKVSDLSNIEFGEKLESINASYTSITNLGSLSTAKNLKSIKAEYCSLTELDLNTFTKLESLYCNNNNLSELKLGSISSLVNLDCQDNKIAKIDLTKLLNLKTINCANNKLEELDLSKNTKLTELNCDNNLLRFSTIKLANQSLFNSVGSQADKYNCGLIDYSDIIDLSKEYLVNGKKSTFEWTTYDSGDHWSTTPTSIDMTDLGNGKFKIAGAAQSKLTCKVKNQSLPNFTMALDFSVNPYDSQNLEGLKQILRQPAKSDGKYNFEILGLTTADTLVWDTNIDWVEKIQNTGYYSGGFMWTTSEDGSKYLSQIHIPNLYGYGEPLAGNFDLSYFPNLEVFQCNGHYISSFNFNNNPKLEIIDIASNNLSTIDITKNTKLTNIQTSNNDIKTLDISKNTMLQTIYCINNNLSELDLSANKALEHLVCTNNKLTILDLTNNEALIQVRCGENLIEEIITPNNISKDLTYGLSIQCEENKMKYSTLPYSEKYILRVYAPSQDTIRGGEIPANKTIDLSSEYAIKTANWSTGTAIIVENTTIFQWIEAVTLEDITHKITNNGDGKFIASNDLVGKTIICKMRNTSYSDLTQLYTVKIVKGTTGIEDEKANGTSITVYPNPVQDVINIESDDIVKSATLFDISGRMVKTESGNVEQINVSDLPKGFYYLKATTQSGKQSTHKIKKQ